MPLTIVPRDAWRPIAFHPDHSEALQLPAINVIFQLRTCTAPCYNQEDCLRTMREQQQHSRAALGLHDIIYNFMLGGDGRVYEGRGWKIAPPPLKKWKKLQQNRYLYIGCIGDYKDTHLSEDIWYTTWEFLEFGVRNNFIKYKAIFKYDTFTQVKKSSSSSESESSCSSTDEDEPVYFCSDYEGRRDWKMIF